MYVCMYTKSYLVSMYKSEMKKVEMLANYYIYFTLQINRIVDMLALPTHGQAYCKLKNVNHAALQPCFLCVILYFLRLC